VPLFVSAFFCLPVYNDSFATTILPIGFYCYLWSDLIVEFESCTRVLQRRESDTRIVEATHCRDTSHLAETRDSETEINSYALGRVNHLEPRDLLTLLMRGKDGKRMNLTRYKACMRRKKIQNRFVSESASQFCSKTLS